MNTKLRFTRVALLAIVMAAGVVVGWLSARPAAADPNWLTLDVNPGTEAGTANNTCAWHNSCTSANTAPEALDWGQPSGWSVNWHSWAYYVGPSTVAGSGTVTQSNSDCYRVQVAVKRPNGTALGNVYYKHTNSAVTGTFTISAGSVLSPSWTSRQVGTTVTSDTCPYLGYHIHQYAESPFAKNMTAYPYNYPPDHEMDGIDITSQSEYQNYVSYQY
jgi:hypothetical protein